MAYVTLPRAMDAVPFFAYPTTFNATFALAILILDATSEKVAFSFQVPKDGTLDKFEFMIRESAQLPTNGLVCSFQDLDATTGFPDGTPDQFRVVTSLTASSWTVPGLITSDGTDTGDKRVVTRGQFLSAVIGFESFNSGDIVRVCGADTPLASNFYSFPSVNHFTSSWSGTTVLPSCLILKYSDGSYAVPEGYMWPIEEKTANGFNVNTSGADEYGLLFSMPFDCRINGARTWLTIGAGSDFEMILYSGTTPLATVAVDGNYPKAVAQRTATIAFEDPVELDANTPYRLAIRPTTANSVSLVSYVFPTTAIRDAWCPTSGWVRTSRLDQGSWTDTTLSLPIIVPLIEAIDIPAGGGGSGMIVHPGMSGGVRG